MVMAPPRRFHAITYRYTVLICRCFAAFSYQFLLCLITPVITPCHCACYYADGLLMLYLRCAAIELICRLYARRRRYFRALFAPRHIADSQICRQRCLFAALFVCFVYHFWRHDAAERYDFLTHTLSDAASFWLSLPLRHACATPALAPAILRSASISFSYLPVFTPPFRFSLILHAE